jgi:hypothetical protein
LVEQCLGIVRNRVGANGVPYVPNRKRAAATPDSRKKPSGRHQGLIEALASLGLTATAAQVEEVLGRLPEGGSQGYPAGATRPVEVVLTTGSLTSSSTDETHEPPATPPPSPLVEGILKKELVASLMAALRARTSSSLNDPALSVTSKPSLLVYARG